MTSRSWNGNREPRAAFDAPRSSFELTAELLALGGLVATLAFFLRAWPGLPDRVPGHCG